MDIEKKRLFIAIKIPVHLRKYLYDFSSYLKKNDPDLKIISKDNIHITLKFLGDTSTTKITEISSVLKYSIKDFKKFNYEVGDLLGAFPTVKNARVLFAPLKLGDKEMGKIFKKLEDNLSGISIPRESKGFTSHITIARIRYQKDITGLSNFAKLEYKKPVKCTGITLFESKLKSGGTEYVVIDEFELK